MERNPYMCPRPRLTARNFPEHLGIDRMLLLCQQSWRWKMALWRLNSSCREPFSISIIMGGRRKHVYPMIRSPYIPDCQVRQQKRKRNHLEGFSFRQLAALTAWKESINRMDLDMLWTFNNIEWFPHVSEDVLVLELLSSHEKVVERQLTNCRHAVLSVIFEAHLSITSWARWVPKVRRCWSGLGLLQELLGQIFRKSVQPNAEYDNCYRHRWCPF